LLTKRTRGDLTEPQIFKSDPYVKQGTPYADLGSPLKSSY